jgi:hypothetical protein
MDIVHRLTGLATASYLIPQLIAFVYTKTENLAEIFVRRDPDAALAERFGSNAVVTKASERRLNSELFSWPVC